MELFGFEITRKNEKEQQKLVSVVPPTNDDGSTLITDYGALGGYYSMSMDLEGNVKNENELIKKYRDIAFYPDCDSAIDEIVNEAVVIDGDGEVVKLDLSKTQLSNSIQKRISEEFNSILNILQFNQNGTDIFRTWYVDGRLFYHIMFQEGKEKEGIKELRYIDPRKIKKVKDIKKEKVNGVDVIKEVREYYIYNDSGINANTGNGIAISLDAVAYCPSGVMDSNNSQVLSYLHKAIKPVNMLKMMEDSLLIYRISRAPERRVFYIDVGSMPKQTAETYVTDLMNRFKNKISYDANTGEVKDERKTMSIMEDFWMPRREGGKGTEITTLPGGQSLGEISDVNYFQQKLFQALNVPLGRLQPQQGFSIGRTDTITRDEIKFNKFVQKLRSKFNKLFIQLLKVQLVSKGILKIEDWDVISNNIQFRYNKDNHFAEMKDNEILSTKVQTLLNMDAMVGKYFSKKWVMENVLKFTEEEIEDMTEEMDEDAKKQAELAAQLQPQQPEQGFGG